MLATVEKFNIFRLLGSVFHYYSKAFTWEPLGICSLPLLNPAVSCSSITLTLFSVLSLLLPNYDYFLKTYYLHNVYHPCHHSHVWCTWDLWLPEWILIHMIKSVHIYYYLQICIHYVQYQNHDHWHCLQHFCKEKPGITENYYGSDKLLPRWNCNYLSWVSPDIPPQWLKCFPHHFHY